MIEQHNIDLGIDISIDSEKRKMTIHYRPKMADTVYDICNFDGRVMHTGVINMDADTYLDLSHLPNGHYTLYIIDSGNIYRELFKL